MAEIWKGMAYLCQTVTVWPDPRDLMMAGSKLFLDNLIRMSAISMGYSHPQAVRIDPTTETVKNIVERKMDGVLKREFSSHGQHVFSLHTERAEDKFIAAMDKEEVNYELDLSKFLRPRWFLQPYIPELRYLGELRIFVVNGIIFKTIITNPNDGNKPLEITEPNILTPLSRIRYVVIDQSQIG